MTHEVYILLTKDGEPWSEKEHATFEGAQEEAVDIIDESFTQDPPRDWIIEKRIVSRKGISIIHVKDGKNEDGSQAYDVKVEHWNAEPEPKQNVIEALFAKQAQAIANMGGK